MILPALLISKSILLKKWAPLGMKSETCESVLGNEGCWLAHFFMTSKGCNVTWVPQIPRFFAANASLWLIRLLCSLKFDMLKIGNRREHSFCRVSRSKNHRLQVKVESVRVTSRESLQVSQTWRLKHLYGVHVPWDELNVGIYSVTFLVEGLYLKWNHWEFNKVQKP